MRRAALAVVVAIVAAASAPAAQAAYAPHAEMVVPTAGGPASPAAIDATITQASGEEATQLVEARLPGAFGFNSAFALVGCAPADEQARRCPDSARIGSIEADSSFGSARGPLFLTEDFRLHGVVEAYGGLFRFPVTGVLQVLPGQQIVVRFADLPAVPTTRMRLALDGGDRTPLALPRDCGRQVIALRLVSHAGTERRSEHPFTVSGCRGLPALEALRFGRGGVLRWRVGAGVARTDVTLLALRGGRWHERGTRHVPARAGTNRLRIAGRWRGRTLAPGRFRAEAVAVAADGTRSLARHADFTVAGR